MTSQATNFFRAMLQGITGAGLFRTLRYPGETDEFIGTETTEEVVSSPVYQHMARVVSEARERAVGERQMAAYYAELYRTEADEHIHEGTCTT